MKTLRRNNSRGILAAMVLGLPLVALSQPYPAKPIRLIAPYPPGGVDSTARLLTPRMGELLGQPIVIENRPGANGNIGTDMIAKAVPDGYTIGFPTSSTLVIGPFLYKNLPFDPLKDFTPIHLPIAGMATVTVNGAVPAKTLRELIDLAKKSPGKLSYGSSGIGGIFHLTGEQLKLSAGIDLFHVPYKGSAPAWLDLVAGRVDVGFPAIDLIRQQVSSGKLRILAVAEAKRHPQLPDVPTVAEVVSGFEKPPSWFGFFGPAGIPPAIQSRLADAALQSLRTPETQTRLTEAGYVTISIGPDDILPMMRRDLERTAKLTKLLGIQPE